MWLATPSQPQGLPGHLLRRGDLRLRSSLLEMIPYFIHSGCPSVSWPGQAPRLYWTEEERHGIKTRALATSLVGHVCYSELS